MYKNIPAYNINRTERLILACACADAVTPEQQTLFRGFLKFFWVRCGLFDFSLLFMQLFFCLDGTLHLLNGALDLNFHFRQVEPLSQ